MELPEDASVKCVWDQIRYDGDPNAFAFVFHPLRLDSSGGRLGRTCRFAASANDPSPGRRATNVALGSSRKTAGSGRHGHGCGGEKNLREYPPGTTGGPPARLEYGAASPPRQRPPPSAQPADSTSWLVRRSGNG